MERRVDTGCSSPPEHREIPQMVRCLNKSFLSDSLFSVFVLTIRIHPRFCVGIANIVRRASPPIGDCALMTTMDLESITPFLAKKNLTAVEIQIEINSVLGVSTVAYSTVTRSLRKRSFIHPSERAAEGPEIEASDAIDEAILQALDETRFPSLRQLAKRILIPMTTIRYRLVNRS